MTQSEEYKIGLIEGTLNALVTTFAEHREEEKQAWKDIETKITNLENFRSKVIGMATLTSATVGIVVTFLVRYIYR